MHGDAELRRRSSDGEEMPPLGMNDIRKAKLRILKNILVISLSFLLNFIAFAGIANLQSSLNPDEGLGTASLAIIYVAFIFSALFTPTYVIRKLGCKWTIFVCILGYTTYYMGNFYPSWATLVPTSIILGLCAGPFWSAKGTYLTTSARRYARLSGEADDAAVNRFFGIFFLIFQMNQIIGNLISSFILSTANSTTLEFPEVTPEETARIESYCGGNDCQNGTGKVAARDDEIPDTTIYILMGIYTSVGFLAAANTALFVDKIQIREVETRNRKELLVATFKHMKDRRQLLLIPITFYTGIEQVFITSDYTKSYVTCPIAVNWVGFVMICYGACDSICSFLFGRAEKYTGRIPLFTLAMLINLAVIITCRVWTPFPYSPAPFFVLPALWGAADSVWQTQLTALYGVLFINHQEEAFANNKVWQSLGFAVAFAYQSFLCVSVKLYILLSVLVLGMSLYYVTEYEDRSRRPSAGPIPIDGCNTTTAHDNKAFDGEDGKAV